MFGQYAKYRPVGNHGASARPRLPMNISCEIQLVHCRPYPVFKLEYPILPGRKLKPVSCTARTPFVWKVCILSLFLAHWVCV